VNRFAQDTGRWYNDAGSLLGVGYSGGNKGNDPEGVNNPALQNLACVGPLPCGFYKIGQPYDHATCGPYFMPLTPAPGNTMYGRGGFGVHGDDVRFPGQKKASDGCIILALGVRQEIGGNLAVNDDLEVVASMDPISQNVSNGTGTGNTTNSQGDSQ
jgi:hypothetical protein